MSPKHRLQSECKHPKGGGEGSARHRLESNLFRVTEAASSLQIPSSQADGQDSPLNVVNPVPTSLQGELCWPFSELQSP